MKRVVVTGGSGKLGDAVVADLVASGWDVLNVDLVPPSVRRCSFLKADLVDFGQVVEALVGADAVVHLAAIPAPGLSTDAVTFENNTVSTYNVFAAARTLGLRNIVWASSETVLGLPFSTPPPYVPVDEEYPGRPESSYSLSKLLGEQMAVQFCRQDPTLKIYGLRFSNVMRISDYAEFP
ncbi:MAG TPA: NAD(P)-dependent oxidoreductase, partial [Micromonosporaceae bacterium]